MNRTMTSASVTAVSAALFAASWVAIIHADRAAAVVVPQQAQTSTVQAGAPGGVVATGQLVPVPAAPAPGQAAPVRRSRAS